MPAPALLTSRKPPWSYSYLLTDLNLGKSACYLPQLSLSLHYVAEARILTGPRNRHRRASLAQISTSVIWTVHAPSSLSTPLDRFRHSRTSTYGNTRYLFTKTLKNPCEYSSWDDIIFPQDMFKASTNISLHTATLNETARKESVSQARHKSTLW
jgi:hypothetical protein